MNMLLLKIRILWKAEKREKSLNAVNLSQYDLISLCEVWLDASVEDSELQLEEYKFHRADRQSNTDYSTHGGCPMDVIKNLDAKGLDIELHVCCIACSMTG